MHTETLRVPLMGELDLEMVLKFNYYELLRVTAVTEHPSTICFNPSLEADVSVRIDAALNFFMWLTGLPHDMTSFQTLRPRTTLGSRRLNMTHLNSLVRHEISHNVILNESHWSAPIRKNVRCYVGESFADLIAQGKSPLLLLRSALSDLKMKGVIKPKRIPRGGRKPNGSSCTRCSAIRRSCDGMMPCDRCTRCREWPNMKCTYPPKPGKELRYLSTLRKDVDTSPVDGTALKRHHIQDETREDEAETCKPLIRRKL